MTDSDDTKSCPYCAETIKSAAIKCRYCGEMLPAAPDSSAATLDAAPATVHVTSEPEAEKQQQTLGLALSCIVIPFALLVFGKLMMMDTKTKSPPDPVRSAVHTIVYQVTGSCPEVAVTYQNASGGTDQKKVSVPWKESFQAGEGTFLYLSAQKQETYGEIKAVIKVDGRVVQSGEATDDYGIASASGSL